MNKPFRIDAHAHAIKSGLGPRLPRPDATSFPTDTQLIELYRAVGINKGILFPLVSPESHHYPITNEEICYIAHDHPDVFYWCCNIDPRVDLFSREFDFSRLIDGYLDNGALGLGELTANLCINDRKFKKLLYACDECGLPITIHWSGNTDKEYGVYGGEEFELLAAILSEFKNLKIIGHSIPFWNKFKGEYNSTNTIIRLMREYPNLCCDTSAGSGFRAFSRNPDYTYRFMDEFQDRIVFGLDIGYREENLHKQIIQFLDEAYENGCISKTVYEKINYKNAISIYKIK